jgi:tetratricopeptide (TPR) repeat protein
MRSRERVNRASNPSGKPFFSRGLGIGLLALTLSACGGAGGVRPGALQPKPDRYYSEQVAKAGQLAKAGQPTQALSLLDGVTAHYESARDPDKTYFCAHSQVEMMLYAAMPAADERPHEILVLESTWADAYLIKGSLQIDLGNLAEARLNLERATALAPLNAVYWGELGHTYHVEKNFPKALEIFKQATTAAEMTRADQADSTLLRRSLRGQGYSLIELDRLDEAEALYRKCLQLEPSDQQARVELDYIAQLRRAKKTNPSNAI